jgi:hypothetical protein
MMETREYTANWLRKKLGREPTEQEITERRDAVWRMHLGSMMVTDLLLRDEAEETARAASAMEGEDKAG